MKLDKEEIIELFNNKNKELKHIINEIIEENDLELLNLIFSCIKNEKSISQRKIDNFMSDIANSLKGTDFFDGNLNLKEKYRNFSDYNIVLIKNLNNKGYKFTINQIKRMSTKTLMFLLESSQDNEKLSKTYFDEINRRINKDRFFFTSENKDSLYLYLLIATKLSDFETLNRLLNNEDFIKTIDTTKIDGSMIITLTNNCNKPRTLLLTKSTKIKKCLLNGDDLFDSEEILSNLTKEEVKLLHQDLTISNFLITNGYRFDVLKEEVEEKIIEDFNIFSVYKINTINAFLSGYKRVHELANNLDFIFLYLNKLNNNYFERGNFIGKISYKVMQSVTLDNRFMSLPEESIYHLIIETTGNIKKMLLSNEQINKTLNDCNIYSVLSSLPKEKIESIVEEKNNLSLENDYELLKLLKRNYLTSLFNKDNELFEELINLVKKNHCLDLKFYFESLPSHLAEHLATIRIEELDLQGIIYLLEINPNYYKKHILKNKDLITSLINEYNIDNLNNLFVRGNFNSKEKLQFINNINHENITNQKNLNLLIDELPEEEKEKVYNDIKIINLMVKNNHLKNNDYTIEYLISNKEKINTIPITQVLDLLASSSSKQVEEILNKDLVLKILNDIDSVNLISLINENSKIKEIIFQKEFIEYYPKELLDYYLNDLSFTEKEKLFTNKLIEKIFKKNEKQIKVYKSLLNNNYYLLDTLQFAIFNEDITKFKISNLEKIVKHKNIQKNIISINKKVLLPYHFLNEMMNILEPLDTIDILNKILELINKSVYGQNRKNVGNFLKILSNEDLNKLSKENIKSFISYFLYIIPRYNNTSEDRPIIVDTPTSLEELLNYELAVENKFEISLKNLTKDEINNYFFIKHFKLSTDEVKKQIALFNIDNINPKIYKKETSYINDLKALINLGEKSLYIFDKDYPIMSIFESFVMEKDLKNMYAKLFNFEIRTKSQSHKNQSVKLYGKEIKLSLPQDDFLYLVSEINLDKDLEQYDNNYLNAWHQVVNNLDSVKTTLISQDYLNIPSKEILFAFNGLSLLGLKNITSSNKNKYNYLPPRDLINTSRDIKNTVELDKNDIRTDYINSNYPNIEPNYIIVTSEVLEDNSYLEKAYRASQDFKSKKNKTGLPIVIIDKEKISNNELTKVNKLYKKYLKTRDFYDLEEVLKKTQVNYYGYLKYDKKLAKIFDNKFIIDTIGQIIENAKTRSKTNLLENIIDEELIKYNNISSCNFDIISLKNIISNK